MGAIIMFGGTLLLLIIGKAASFIDEMEAKRKRETGVVLSAEIENMDDNDKLETESSNLYVDQDTIDDDSDGRGNFEGLEIIKAIVWLAILLCLPWIILLVQLFLFVFSDEEFVLR